jgi:hypothetical protein
VQILEVVAKIQMRGTDEPNVARRLLLGRFIGSTEWSHGAFFDVKNPMEVGFPAAVLRDLRQVSSRHFG